MLCILGVVAVVELLLLADTCKRHKDGKRELSLFPISLLKEIVYMLLKVPRFNILGSHKKFRVSCVSKGNRVNTITISSQVALRK